MSNPRYVVARKVDSKANRTLGFVVRRETDNGQDYEIQSSGLENLGVKAAAHDFAVGVNRNDILNSDLRSMENSSSKMETSEPFLIPVDKGDLARFRIAYDRKFVEESALLKLKEGSVG